MEARNALFIGNDSRIAKAREFARTIAVTKTPALIVGEYGTGKKTLCAYIHANSSRNSRPLIVVDCAKSPEAVENEVLGHRDEETGRFNKGALEAANGGTVIFANVDALEENFQKRLLKILSELNDYEIDVRVLATTTKNLSKYVGAGRFSRGLYTYFSGTQMTLSALRERGDDLVLIANDIMNQIDPALTLSTDAVEKLQAHYWSHNVAELDHVIRNSAINAEENLITADAIEFGDRKSEEKMIDIEEDGIRLMSLREAEKLLIKKALLHTSENRTQAAKILGVSIRTLRNKINEYRTEGTSYFMNLR